MGVATFLLMFLLTFISTFPLAFLVDLLLTFLSTLLLTFLVELHLTFPLTFLQWYLMTLFLTFALPLVERCTGEATFRLPNDPRGRVNDPCQGGCGNVPRRGGVPCQFLGLSRFNVTATELAASSAFAFFRGLRR